MNLVHRLWRDFFSGSNEFIFSDSILHTPYSCKHKKGQKILFLIFFGNGQIGKLWPNRQKLINCVKMVEMTIITPKYYPLSHIKWYKYTEQQHLLILFWIFKMVKWVKFFKLKMVKSVSKGIIGFKLVQIRININHDY